MGGSAVSHKRRGRASHVESSAGADPAGRGARVATSVCSWQGHFFQAHTKQESQNEPARAARDVRQCRIRVWLAQIESAGQERSLKKCDFLFASNEMSNKLVLHREK